MENLMLFILGTLGTIMFFNEMFGVIEIALAFATPFIIIYLFAYLESALDIKEIKKWHIRK